MLLDDVGEDILGFTTRPHLHRKPATRPKHSPHFTDSSNGIRKEHEARLTDDCVK
jgi:hypothetical protein